MSPALQRSFAEGNSELTTIKEEFLEDLWSDMKVVKERLVAFLDKADPEGATGRVRRGSGSGQLMMRDAPAAKKGK